MTTKTARGLSLRREELSTLCSWVEKAAGKSGLRPVLGCLHLKTDGDLLRVSATDLESYARGHVAVERHDHLDCCVNATLLRDAMRKMPAETLTLRESSEGTLCIESTDTQLDFPLLAGEDFPEPPSLPDDAGSTANIMAGVLLDCCKAVKQVVSREDDPGRRFQFKGVWLRIESGKLLLQATNGRMGLEVCGQAPFQHTPRKEQLIIPVTGFQLILAATKDDRQQEVRVTLLPSEIVFATDESLVRQRLLEGRFPDVAKITKETQKVAATVRTTAGVLRAAVQQCAIVADSARFSIDAEDASLCIQAQGDNGKADLALDIDGDDAVTGSDDVILDLDYLLAALSALDASEPLTFATGGQTAATIAAREGDFFFALAPMGENEAKKKKAKKDAEDE